MIQFKNCFWFKVILLGFLLEINPFGLIAQGPPCLTNQIRQRNFQRFPELEVGYLQTPDIALNQYFPVASRTVTTVPVVVHIVYKGNLENISEEQIRSQLEVLNQDFRKLNPDQSNTPPFFAPVAADMSIEFCLAAYDPDGNPTTGITRQETPWSNIGLLTAPDGRPRINYTDLGGTDAWDTKHYLNIWVCSIGGGVLGFGTYPGTAPPAEDGVVIDPRYFGTTGLATFNPPHHLGRTATHEIGHYFNLLHIWGDDELSCFDDDEVNDTPVQRGPYLGCPVYPQFSCGNSAMFMNFMDYTNDACMTMFTEGQKIRLRNALDSLRAGLSDSVNCTVSSFRDLAKQQTNLQLYPNPASEILYFEPPSSLGDAFELRVFDHCGKCWIREIRATGQVKIPVDLTSIPTGVYSLQLVFPTGLVHGSFIKI